MEPGSNILEPPHVPDCLGLMVVIWMVAKTNVGLEVTKGVGKVVVQELHGILELVCW